MVINKMYLIFYIICIKKIKKTYWLCSWIMLQMKALLSIQMVLSCILCQFVSLGFTHLRAVLVVLPWQVPCCSVSHKSFSYQAILVPCDSQNYSEQSQHWCVCVGGLFANHCSSLGSWDSGWDFNWIFALLILHRRVDLPFYSSSHITTSEVS